VARSVEAKVVEETVDGTEADGVPPAGDDGDESPDQVPDATIEGSTADDPADPAGETGTQED